jgi:SAM-dependent methyltransferase
MGSFDGREYQARFDALAAEGRDVHGEVEMILSLRPASVLDAGCGTGRVAIELARRGVEVVGVDVDPSMIAEARRRNPGLDWVEGDLAGLDLGRQFDVVVLAGNVPLFCPPALRNDMIAACAAHVGAGGAMVAGFQLDRGYRLSDYDGTVAASGLKLADRWSTWDGQPFFVNGPYAVSVHRPRQP